MDDVTIRPERHGDEGAIQAVNDAAFGGPVEAGIVDAIRGTDRWIDGGSLVAEAADGEIVGHLLLSVGDLVAPDGGIRRSGWWDRSRSPRIASARESADS